jgi:hypothetical protein
MMSEIFTFTTLLAPPQPSYPDNGATNVPQALETSWQSIPGASYYGLQLASDASFANCWINVYDITGTSFQLTGLSPLETYYWRVCAVNDGGHGEWSVTRSFTVRQAAIDFPGAVTISENTDLVLYFQNYIDDYDPSIYQVTVENNINLQIGMFADRTVITPPNQWFGSEQLLIKVFTLPRNGQGVTRQQDRIDDEPIYQDTLDVTVYEVNDLPVLSLGTGLIFWNTEDKSIDLSPYLSDADDTLDNIMISAVSGTDISVSVAGHVLTFTAPDNWFGTNIIEIGISNPVPEYGNRFVGRTESNIYYVMVSFVDATPKLTCVHYPADHITISWATISGAEGYCVYGLDSPAGEFIDVTDNGSLWQENGITHWQHQAIAPRKFYCVRAYKNGRGISIGSRPVQPILPVQVEKRGTNE